MFLMLLVGLVARLARRLVRLCFFSSCWSGPKARVRPPVRGPAFPSVCLVLFLWFWEAQPLAYHLFANRGAGDGR